MTNQRFDECYLRLSLGPEEKAVMHFLGMVEHCPDLIKRAAAGTLPCLGRGGYPFGTELFTRSSGKVAAIRIMLSASANLP